MGNNPTLTMRVYLPSFSRCYIPKLRSSAQNSETIWIYISLRSSKVDDFGHQSKAQVKYVINLGHYLAPFLRYGELLPGNCVFFNTLSHSALHSLCSLWNFAVKLTVSKLESYGATLWWRLHNPNFNHFWLIHPCDGRTDNSICSRALKTHKTADRQTG